MPKSPAQRQREYIQRLKEQGRYDGLKEKVRVANRNKRAELRRTTRGRELLKAKFRMQKQTQRARDKLKKDTLSIMVSYVECEEFDIKHEDDPLSVTKIKTESQDMKCEIKIEPKDCVEFPDDADVKDQILAESQLVSTMKKESEMVDTSDLFHIVHKNNEIKEEKIEADETNPITEDAEYLAKNSLVAYTDIYYEYNTSREELQTYNVTDTPVFQHNEAINNVEREAADKSKVEIYNVEKNIHTGQNQFKCDICNKTFIWKSSLLKHLNSHNSVKHVSCDICRKSFSRKSYLTNHLQVHDPVKTYTCNVCSRTFIKRSFLTKHLYVHSVEKRYMCDICNKSFSWKFHLDKHKRLHDGQKSLSSSV